MEIEIWRPKGVIVPLVTPYLPTGLVDFSSLHRLVRRLETHSQAVIANATTGDGSMLHRVQRLDVITRLKAVTSLPVLACIMPLSTEHAEDEMRSLAVADPVAVLVTLPLYMDRLSTGAMVRYFTRLTEFGKPIILYNIPSRLNGLEITLEAARELSGNPSVIGEKESGSSEQRLAALAELQDPEFSLACGNQRLLKLATELNVDGVVPSTANLFPENWGKWEHQRRSGEPLAAILETLDRHLQIFDPQYTDAACLKRALKILGVIDHDEVAQPGDMVCAEHEFVIRQTLHQLGHL